MKKAVLGIVIAAIVLVVAIAMRGQSDESKLAAAGAKADEKARTAKASSETVLTIAPGMRRTTSAPTGPSRTSPLMAQFTASHDYKAIYDRLKQLANPSPEEQYLMAHILETCADITERPGGGKRNQRWRLGGEDSRRRFEGSLSPKVPNRQQRLDAFDKINYDECAGLETLKITEKEMRAIYERAAAAGDPKARAAILRFQLQDQWRDAKGEYDFTRPMNISDPQIDQWKGIMESGDPWAVVDAVQALSGFLSNRHLRDPNEVPIDFQALYLASTLVSCDLGRDCGPNTRYLLQGCALNGACDAADYRDYVFFYSAAPGSSQRIDEYRAHLLDAINRRDWSFFTFAPGPAPFIAGFQSSPRSP